MFVYVFRCVHAGKCSHLCMYVWKSDILSVFLSHFSPYFCKTESHIEHCLARLTRNPLVSASPALGWRAHATMSVFCLFVFIWLLIIWTQILMFAGERLYLQNHPPSYFSHHREIHQPSRLSFTSYKMFISVNILLSLLVKITVMGTKRRVTKEGYRVV